MNDDDNDVFYDYIDNTDTDNTITNDSNNGNNINENDIKCRLLQLSPLIIIDQILPYIQTRPNLSIIATCCTYLCDLLYSKHATNLWNKNMLPMYMCIDSYCPLCPYKKVRSTDNTGALNFLRDVPIQSVVIHCFITDIPRCLEALATLGCLVTLEVKLTNKSNSPSLEELLKRISFTGNGYIEQKQGGLFPCLKNLILDSSNLTHVNLGGRFRLLELLGANLESLSFRGLCPTGLFSILGGLCPKLKRLRVDKVMSLIDLLSYENPDLEKLELIRANFVLHNLLPFPKLKTLIYTPSMRCEESQIEGLVFAVPITLLNISLEIPSEMVNHAINAISKKLKIIEKITLQASYGVGKVEATALSALGKNCVQLKSFEIISMKSVHNISFEPFAFKSIGTFLACESVLVQFEENVVTDLVDTLKRSLSLREVILWQRHKWIPKSEWIQMDNILKKIALQFPHVQIRLEKR